MRGRLEKKDCGKEYTGTYIGMNGCLPASAVRGWPERHLRRLGREDRGQDDGRVGRVAALKLEAVAGGGGHDDALLVALQAGGRGGVSHCEPRAPPGWSAPPGAPPPPGRAP